MLRAIRSAVLREFRQEGMEVVEWSLYDSLFTTVSIAQTLTFFQQTISIGENRTNMQSAGQLPKPKSFLINSLTVKLVNLDGTSMYGAGGAAPAIYPPNVIFSKMTGQINVDPSDKYFFHAMNYYTLADYWNDTGTTLASAVTRPSKSEFTVPLKIPIILGSNRAFNVTIRVTTPAAAQGYTASNTAFYVFLNGWLQRNKG